MTSRRRDVAAARKAGFGRTVILRDSQKSSSAVKDPTFVPDYTIDNLKELLDLFPISLQDEW